MWLKNIPKKIHLYWGNENISFLRYLTPYSLIKYNPDWEVIMLIPEKITKNEKTWTTDENKIVFSGEDYYDRMMKLPMTIVKENFDKHGINNNFHDIQKSDILRWKILSDDGGAWADMDMLFVKPMEYIVQYVPEDKLNMNTVIARHPIHLYYSISFLMSSANNPFYRYLYEKALQTKEITNYQQVGSGLFEEFVNNVQSLWDFKNCNVYNIPNDLVYPILWNQTDRFFNKSNVGLGFFDKSIGVHWFAGSKVSGESEAIITEKNIKDNDSMAKRIASYIMEEK